ncbi:MAG: hypothetical protein IPK71_00145 [Myxococcales bacterium]|jgi:hypothetical protein|nr:hypothetical protein [Myxococcales bacterium]
MSRRFHIVEKLWACGEAIHPNRREAVTAWYAKQTKLQRRRGAGAVIANLRAALAAVPKTGPGTKRRRKLLSKTYRHLLRHMPHMLYASLRARDLDIATGAVEGAVRNVVRMRLDGPGMRWSQERAERVLHLRNRPGSAAFRSVARCRIVRTHDAVVIKMQVDRAYRSTEGVSERQRATTGSSGPAAARRFSGQDDRFAEARR